MNGSCQMCPVTNMRYQLEAAGKTYLVVIDRWLDPKF